MPIDDWDQVRDAVDRIAEASVGPFASNTIANAHDLIGVCRSATVFPSSVTKGYWATISLSWEGFEIEVFDDRLEVYRFHDRRTDIWYEDHAPARSFSPRFLAELELLKPKT